MKLLLTIIRESGKTVIALDAEAEYENCPARSAAAISTL
jgi:hypothetical protein